MIKFFSNFAHELRYIGCQRFVTARNGDDEGCIGTQAAKDSFDRITSMRFLNKKTNGTVRFDDQWTDCIIDKIFKNIEIVKFVTIALKSVIKLAKLKSLVAKCCKMQKI